MGYDWSYPNQVKIEGPKHGDFDLLAHRNWQDPECEPGYISDILGETDKVLLSRTNEASTWNFWTMNETSEIWAKQVSAEFPDLKFTVTYVTMDDYYHTQVDRLTYIAGRLINTESIFDSDPDYTTQKWEGDDLRQEDPNGQNQ